MKRTGFIVSVIMPVYNVENYLTDAVESIIRQTIGFRDNIQIILVNDGSTDGSGIICRKYQESYPDNILFIDKPNGGVSSARNAGKRHACGEFISFLDPDDMWEDHAFEHFLAFFDKHPDIEFASARMEMFGRKNGFMHHLDYEYKKTRIVSIAKTYNFPQFSAARTMFRASAITDLWFDESLSIAEDMLFMNTLVLREKRYGVIREAVYRYRRVSQSGSAIDNQWRKKGFYLDIINKVHRKLIDMSISEYGEVTRYLQYLMITDFRYRITKPHEEVLTDTELDDYMNMVREILLLAEDDIILENRGLTLVLKIDALRAKYGDEAFDRNERLKAKIADMIKVTCSGSFVCGSDIVLTGAAIEKYVGNEYQIIAVDENGCRYGSVYEEAEDSPYLRRFAPGTMTKYSRRTYLPSAEDHTYSFHLSGDTGDTAAGNEKPLKIMFGKGSRLSSVEGSYWLTDKSIVRATKDGVSIGKRHLFTGMQAEKRYIEHIKEAAGNDEAERRKRVRKALEKKNRPLWILAAESKEGASDLLDKFFCLKKEGKALCDIRIMCADVQMIRRIPEELLINDTEEYKDLFLIADAVLLFDSSDKLREPLGKNVKYFRDIAAPEIKIMYSCTVSQEKTGELENE